MSDLAEKMAEKSDAIMKILGDESPVQVVEQSLMTKSVHLVARTREEMAECQSEVSRWLGMKLTVERERLKELQENLDLAVKNKWRTTTLRKHVGLALNTIIYYEKMKEAVDEGYAIIPDFPARVFAIRKDDERPRGTSRQLDPDENLAVGKGQYFSPEAKGYSTSYTTGTPGKDLRVYWTFHASEFQQVAFPLVAVKPEVMREAGEAMRKKIFDSISVFLPESQRIVEKPSSGVIYRDPMIVGRITGPKRYALATPPSCCFLIAWFLDLRTL